MPSPNGSITRNDPLLPRCFSAGTGQGADPCPCRRYPPDDARSDPSSRTVQQCRRGGRSRTVGRYGYVSSPATAIPKAAGCLIGLPLVRVPRWRQWQGRQRKAQRFPRCQRLRRSGFQSMMQTTVRCTSLQSMLPFVKARRWARTGNEPTVGRSSPAVRRLRTRGTNVPDGNHRTYIAGRACGYRCCGGARSAFQSAVTGMESAIEKGGRAVEQVEGLRDAARRTWDRCAQGSQLAQGAERRSLPRPIAWPTSPQSCPRACLRFRIPFRISWTLFDGGRKGCASPLVRLA